MATRSTIAKVNEDGSVIGVYCHWDGYLDGVGETLKEVFNTQELVDELINLGQISSLSGKKRLKPNADEVHSFDKQLEDVVVAYHRDRGEDLCIYEADSIKEFEKKFKEEYSYYFIDGKWNYIEYDKKMKLL